MPNEKRIADIVHAQEEFFNSSATRSYDFRARALRRMKRGILKFEPRLRAALAEDLGKSEFEAYATEIGFVLHDLTHTLRNLRRWMRPRRVKTPPLCQPASSRIHYCPLGVNLVISPFNYPVGLTFAPLAAAVAAGNTVVLKTSEMTPACSAAIGDLVAELFDPAHVAHVEGGVPETTALLKQKFDHIFFTGSPRVGAIVMEAAARHLIPVTLELGGKSPCIVHADAKMDVAVRRIAYGKFMNAGQTCVAPDFVLVQRSVQEAFLEKMCRRIGDLYGEDPALSPDFGRIVNARHHSRIVALIDPDKVVAGGAHDAESLFIAPTVMRDVVPEDDVMAEEIFGPVLPVMAYDDVDDIPGIVAKLPRHPLACYIFSESRAVQRRLVSRLQFGGGCINHCIQHLVNPNLPFGGVGESGIGSYHGFNGFEAFSHRKSVMKAATWFDLPLIYPPYGKKTGLLRKIMR